MLFRSGQRLGLPLEQVCEVLRHGAAGSWALEHRSEAMRRDHYPLGFRLALHRKDLAIALGTAESVGLDLPISRLVAAMEDALIDAGQGDQDVSVLRRWFNPASGDPPVNHGRDGDRVCRVPPGPGDRPPGSGQITPTG